jgi:copper chaperone
MRITLHIQNLKHEGCEKTIIKRVSQQKNISEVEVSLEDETVSFNYHTSHDFERAKHVLEMIGHPIEGPENNLPI